jgi:hypothetical protein
MFMENGSVGSDLIDGRSRGILTLAGQDGAWWNGLRLVVAGRPQVAICISTLAVTHPSS